MRRMTVLHWLLLLPALLLLGLCLAVTSLVLASAPPVVGIVAGWVAVVAGLWLFLVRRRGPGVVSEAGYLSQHSSKDGLL